MPGEGLIERVIEQLAGGVVRDASVERARLNGGMEASAVFLVTARYRDEQGRPRMLRFVIKQLAGRAVREADVYQHLASPCAFDLAPRLLAVERDSAGMAMLCLEAVRRVSAWPWGTIALGGELLARLARFHEAAAQRPTALPAWDYEAELCAIAEATREEVERCRRSSDLSALSATTHPLRRIVDALPKLRRQLLRERPFTGRAIHGDVHPGNALVRRRGGGPEPALLDWGRARWGSPLEDVASWLQSLGLWENEARRRHDTLFAAYLSAAGYATSLNSPLRAVYWMAGASNAVSGALLHNVRLARDERQPAGRRAVAFRSAQHWLRVIRRADAWCA